MTFWRQGWDRLSPQDATASEAVFAHRRMGGSEICLCSWKHHKLNCSFVGMCLRSTAIVHGQCMSCRGTCCLSFDVCNNVLDAHTGNTNSCQGRMT